MGDGLVVAYLRVDNLQDQTLRTIPIRKRKFTIGRGMDNAIQLDDITISRTHTEIILDHSKFVLIDNNSTNGTWFQNEKIENKELVHFEFGTTFRIGSFQISILKPDVNAEELISSPTKST